MLKDQLPLLKVSILTIVIIRFLCSLPRMFKTTSWDRSIFDTPLSQVPSDIPQTLRFEKPPGGLSVGLVWASDPTNRSMYKHKSIPLQLLMPRLIDLAQLDLIDIHSLQVGADVNQLLHGLHLART